MHLMETLSAWSRALRDPSLRDLPYKVETNEYGQLVMTPTRPAHSHAQAEIAGFLRELIEAPGRGAVEFAVDTPKGVKVTDVAWMSEERWQEYAKDADASPIAPEICVEVLSKSNTRAEIEEKMELYLGSGAVEVWTCDVDGRMRFFAASGELPASELVPEFPTQVEL